MSLRRRGPSHTLKRLLRCSVVGGWVMLLVLFLSFAPLHASSPEYQLVRLHFKHPSQLQAWVDGGLDVWHVDGHTALVSLPKTQIRAFQAKRIRTEFVPQPAMASFPACYRTYADMVEFFNDRASVYPHLLQWVDVGDSWEKANGLAGGDLYVARLTSPEGPDKKPKFFLVAELHAREIITPEVAMNFADDLLRNYGQDPTVTWLLDNREVWVMPMANPDGHAQAVQAENWRKNARLTASCEYGAPPNSFGVDLNRNYGFQWGLDTGSSADPCNLTYRGEGPYSEPETQAIRDLVREQDFDILVSLHSWGDEVLYPWAHTWDTAPDANSLGAMATRMAAVSGYTAKQTSQMGYVSSGDAADWSYGELGIASFTLEVGGMEDGFFWPPCEKQDQLYQEVRPALIYAAMVAHRPYEVAGGPEAHEISVEPDGREIRVRARVSDQWSGDDRILTAELFLEELGAPGTGIRLSPVDGNCNSDTEWFTTNLDERVLLRFAGRRVPLLIVAEEVTGTRGVPAVAWLDLRDYDVPASTVVSFRPVGAQELAFAIQNGRVFQGPATAGNVVMTVRDRQVYVGEGVTGELLYTLEDGQVRVGEAGPVIYAIRDHRIYQGPPEFGVVRYRIDHDRILGPGHSGDDIVASANINLAIEEMEQACLLLPVLMDRLY